MPTQPNNNALSDRDYELISAYIDEMVSDEERIEVETRLQSDALFRRELEAMRQTVNFINQMPIRSAPRDFTLTPDMVAPKQPDLKVLSKRRNNTVWLSAAAGFIVILFAGILFASVLDNTPTIPEASNQAVANAPTEIAMTATIETETIETNSTSAESAETLDGIAPTNEAIERSVDDVPNVQSVQMTATVLSEVFNASPTTNLADDANTGARGGAGAGGLTSTPMPAVAESVPDAEMETFADSDEIDDVTSDDMVDEEIAPPVAPASVDTADEVMPMDTMDDDVDMAFGMAEESDAESDMDSELSITQAPMMLTAQETLSAIIRLIFIIISVLGV